MLFESFTRKKELEEYNSNLAKYSEGYAELEVLGEVEGFPINHLVINPSGKRRIFIASGLDTYDPAGPYGILEFVKQRIRVPKAMRVDIVPVVNPAAFVGINESEESKLILETSGVEYLHVLRGGVDADNFSLSYSHHKSLAQGIVNEVAKNYFAIKDGSPVIATDVDENIMEGWALLKEGIPYLATETPGKGFLRNKVRCNRDIIKYVIHNL